MIKVLFFGSVKEIAGVAEAESYGRRSVATLVEELESRYPELKGRKYKIAVNKKIVTDIGTEIPADAEVAILPPFSGG